MMAIGSEVVMASKARKVDQRRVLTPVFSGWESFRAAEPAQS